MFVSFQCFIWKHFVGKALVLSSQLEVFISWKEEGLAYRSVLSDNYHSQNLTFCLI